MQVRYRPPWHSCVEFRVTLGLVLHVVNHGQWHFIFGIKVKQTGCFCFGFVFVFFSVQQIFFGKILYSEIRGKINNACVTFFKSVSLFRKKRLRAH